MALDTVQCLRPYKPIFFVGLHDATGVGYAVQVICHDFIDILYLYVIRNLEKAIVVPNYKGGDRSVIGNYRPVSLTSVVCKQMEHVIAGYLRQVWEMNEWLYEGERGFRPGYSCENQVVTVYQDSGFIGRGFSGQSR